MGDIDIKIMCSADDAVPIAESEDDSQRLLHHFNTREKKFQMNISMTKN